MDKAIANLRAAADSLKVVIQGYKLPLDTVEFEKAVAAVESEFQKPVAPKPDVKADSKLVWDK